MARLLILVVFSFAFAKSIAQKGSLIVIVKGIQVSKGGELSTGIFTKENFPKLGRQLIGDETTITMGEMQIVFQNVPVGTYGVVSFQDIDKNKKLKSNFLGYPTEPIGFSRDARIKLGPPSFDDAKITITPNEALKIIINLK